MRLQIATKSNFESISDIVLKKTRSFAIIHSLLNLLVSQLFFHCLDYFGVHVLMKCTSKYFQPFNVIEAFVNMTHPLIVASEGFFCQEVCYVISVRCIPDNCHFFYTDKILGAKILYTVYKITE